MTDSIDTTVGSTSSSLLHRVKACDQEAWARLVRLYAPLVDFWLRRAGLQSADTPDVFQEVFRAVAEGIDTFRKDRPSDTFRGWLRTIARFKAADHFRHAEGQPIAEGGSEAYRQLQEVEDRSQDCEDPEDPSEANAIDQLRRRAMELIRGEFEPRTWEMFWRVTVEDQTASAVAADMGVSQGAVRLAKFRVLHRLREELEGLEEF